MSIALSTILLFFLLIPGIIFRRFYFSEEFSKEFIKETFFNVFLSTLLPSFVFQCLWFFIFQKQIDLSILIDLISSKPSQSSFENVQSCLYKIFSYNISMFIIAGVLGHYLKKVVRVKKWDRLYKLLRFQNSWHYILKGEFFDFPRAEVLLEKDLVEDIEFVFVSATMESNGQSILYDGFLVDYELSNDGGLKNITLKSVKSKLSQKDSEYYSVPGHILLLKYSEIKSLNFTYYKIILEDEQYLPKPVE